MNDVRIYIKNALDINLDFELISAGNQSRLPLYIREAYNFYFASFFEQPIVLVELKDESVFTNTQLEKHLALIAASFQRKPILVVRSATAVNRKRLIDRGINFIVPGKQLFLPALLIDLRENFDTSQRKKTKQALLPSSQFILLYNLLYKNKTPQLTDLSFKQIAQQTGYSPMAITKTAEDLEKHGLCEIAGGKEKYFLFEYSGKQLWEKSLPYLVNPILKKLYVDKKPQTALLNTGLTALAEYSDVNPAAQISYAIEKTIFYGLQKNGGMFNENDEEGPYCIEVWKYDPVKLANGMSRKGNVDPLSLYLCLKNNPDERVEMALEQIVKDYLW